MIFFWNQMATPSAVTVGQKVSLVPFQRLLSRSLKSLQRKKISFCRCWCSIYSSRLCFNSNFSQSNILPQEDHFSELVRNRWRDRSSYRKEFLSLAWSKTFPVINVVSKNKDCFKFLFSALFMRKRLMWEYTALWSLLVTRSGEEYGKVVTSVENHVVTVRYKPFSNLGRLNTLYLYLQSGLKAVKYLVLFRCFLLNVFHHASLSEYTVGLKWDSKNGGGVS